MQYQMGKQGEQTGRRSCLQMEQWRLLLSASGWLLSQRVIFTVGETLQCSFLAGWNVGEEDKVRGLQTQMTSHLKGFK